MKYSDINLKLNTNIKTFSINPEQEVQVLQYLPIEAKNDIIYIALQNAEENGIYNLLKLRMFFDLYITYLYTDLEFTDEEKDNPAELYDVLNSNGIISAIFNHMNSNEVKYLNEILEETLRMRLEYKSTIASVINGFIEDLPANAQAAKRIIEKFNPEDFQQVIQFAQAANGNRPIV